MSTIRLRRTWLTGPAVALALLLTACGGSSGEPTADESPTDTAAEQDASTAEHDAAIESADPVDSEGDQACFEAFALVRMVDPGLRVRAEQGPLTEDDVAELFSDTAPYVDRLSADVRTEYDTFHDAALSAVGLEDAEVDAILDRPEVEAAVAAVSDTLKTMSACL